MRAAGSDISELFGYSPDDRSRDALRAMALKQCPFTNAACSKTNHDKSEVYGVCSVSRSSTPEPGSDVIICPKRMYANHHALLREISGQFFEIPADSVFVGGTLTELRRKIDGCLSPHVAVAFGQGSGKELQVSAGARLSMDWIVQRYGPQATREPLDFVGIEVQSIDITGNYRANWSAYQALKGGSHVADVPNSNHGLNWANVHKRLIPQLVRKGNVYSKVPRCAAFFFLVPDVVYSKFEEVLGRLPIASGPGRDVISIVTVSLSDIVLPNSHRQIHICREIHHKLDDVKAAFSNTDSLIASSDLDEQLLNLLKPK